MDTCKLKFRNITFRLMTGLFLCHISLSCGTEAGNPEEPVQENRDSDGVLSLNLTAVLDTGTKAVDSVLAIESNDLAGGGTALTGVTSGSTPYCTSTGQPISATSSDNTETSDGISYMSQSHKNYAAGYFYCLLRQDTNSFESIPGALVRAKIWPCVVGKIRFDGVKTTKTSELNSDLANCLGTSRFNSLKTAGITILETTYTATETNTGIYTDWDGIVTFENKLNGNSRASERVLIKKSDNIEAYAELITETDGRADGFIFYFNKSTNKIYYERWSPSTGTNSGSTYPNTYHVRALVGGEVTNDLFTKVTSLKAMRGNSEFYSNKSQSQFMTIDGNPSNGYRTHHRSCNENFDCASFVDYTKWPQLHTSGNCYGGTSCTGDINLDSQTIKFILDEKLDANVKSTTVWFEALSLPASNLDFTTGR